MNALTLSSQLTFDTVSSNLAQLRACIKKYHAPTMRLDLSAITLCDSAGLALLIEAKRLCQQHNKALVIENAPKAVQALAAFCGVETLLNKHDNLIKE